MSRQLGTGHTFAVAADELDDFVLRNELPDDEAAKARWDLERAVAKGFAFCEAVFVEYRYDGLCEKAHPTDGKLNWGRGQNVVDSHFFRDGKLERDPSYVYPPLNVERDWLAHGLRCVVVMSKMGHRCGYVQVPEGHVLHREPYNKPNAALAASLDARMQKPLGEDPGISVLLACLSGEVEARPDVVFEVHGGITYGDELHGFEGWWFGFDCMHSGDAKSPEAQAEEVARYGAMFANDGGHYWLTDEVAAECERLASQLAAIAAPETAR